MKLSKQNEILERVNELLQQSRVKTPPVNVEQVAGTLKIHVRKSPTEDEISGFLLRQPEGPVVIGVNSLHHPNRQRFTIGHEIGHFLLHEYDKVHVDRSMVKLRSSASSTGEDEEEVEANRFAAELLMPRTFLDRDVKELLLRDLLDDKWMQQLAKRYAVSVQAMTNRLISLGYLSADQLGAA